MHKSSNLLGDLFRLLLLVVLLPLFIFFSGPLLVAAAILKKLSVFGLLQLEPGRRHRWGRLGAFIIGMVVWALVWTGAAWLWLDNRSTIFALAGVAQTPVAQTGLPSATPTMVLDSSDPLDPTPTATLVVATSTPTPSPTPTPIILPSATPTPSPPPSPTATHPPTVAPTPTPISPTPTPTLVVPLVTLAPTDEPQVLEVLVEANNLFIRAAEAPLPDNLAALEMVWQAEALEKIQAFVGRINRKYQPPLQVSYRTIGKPEVSLEANTSNLSVQARELWIFEDAVGKKESLNDYTYTLQEQDNRWVIVAYDFEVLPLTSYSEIITPTQ
jgi:hypothetical protein